MMTSSPSIWCAEPAKRQRDTAHMLANYQPGFKKRLRQHNQLSSVTSTQFSKPMTLSTRRLYGNCGIF